MTDGAYNFCRTLLLMACAAAAGCAVPKKPAVAPPTTEAVAVVPPVVRTSQPLDAQQTGQRYFQIEFIQLAIPVGQISGNADFWKPFDETFLGFEVHAMLDANGIRVGRAPRTELEAIKDLLMEAEQKKSSLVGTAARDFEIEVRTNVDRQTVNVFDIAGRQSMRDYEHCEDLFAINFRQAPRQPDRVQLAIAPAVREQKPRLSFDPSSGAIEWMKPRSLYDLSIRLDLGAEDCLVIAPSPRATDNTLAVGRIFLMEERPAAVMEKVIVIIPVLSVRYEVGGR